MNDFDFNEGQSQRTPRKGGMLTGLMMRVMRTEDESRATKALYVVAAAVFAAALLLLIF